MKFILAGGDDQEYDGFGRRLAQVIRGEIAEPKFLDCFFAGSEESTLEQAHAWVLWYQTYFGQGFSVDLATADGFYEQLDQADVLYLHGGETERLKAALPDYDRFTQAIAGKIVIGSSAGANYVSTVNYSPSAGAVLRGAGALKASVVVHYGAESFKDEVYSRQRWQDVIAAVKDEAGDSLPCILIPEGDFVVIEQ